MPPASTHPGDSSGEVVAFLLAVVTGYPSVAGRVLGTVRRPATPMARLADVVTTAAGPSAGRRR